MTRRCKAKTSGPPPHQTELPMLVAPTPLPPMAELFTKAQLEARHAHLLNVNRVTWALRRRATNGLSTAIFVSPFGELVIHEPCFLAWFLGLGGRGMPRAGRRGGRRSGGVAHIEKDSARPC